MTDWPRQAGWLTGEESQWLEQTLQNERAEAASAGGLTFGKAMRQTPVWLLAMGILATNTGGYAMGFWLPTFLNNLLKGSPASALNFLGLGYLGGLVGVFVSGQSSDRPA